MLNPSRQKVDAARCIPIPAAFSAPDPGWLEHWVDRMRVDTLELPDTQLEALSRLVPALLCGEQSAVCAFSASAEHANSIQDRAGAKALQQIAIEELHHEQALQLLMDKLPTPSDLHKIQRRSQRFYLGLGRDISRPVHFYQISLLDSAVAIIMHSVEHSSIKEHVVLCELFSKIKQDEARHSTMGKHYAEAFGMKQEDKYEQQQQIFNGLRELLEPLNQAFESIGVDSLRMWQRIERLLLS